MKFELAKFKAGLNKCIGIVNSQDKLKILTSFYLKPDMKNNKVYLAGSDGIIRLLDKIDCEFEDGEDDEILFLPSSKLYQIVKCATENISIKNTQNSAIIISGRKKWTIGKEEEKENEYVDVPFECFDIKTFNDELDAEKLLFVIERLVSNIHNPTEASHEFKRVYIDGEKAYSSSPTFLTVAEFKTNGKYIFDEKMAKSLIDLLKGYSGKVFLTYDEADTEKIKVVIRTSTAVFVFNNKCGDDFYEIEEVNTLFLENAIVLDRYELVNLINCAKITSGDNHISISIEPGKGANGKFAVHSKDTTGGEFDGAIDILKCKRTEEEIKDKDKANTEAICMSLIKPYKFTISLEDFFDAVKIIKSKHIIFRYSTCYYYVSISDEKNSYRSIIAIGD